MRTDIWTPEEDRQLVELAPTHTSIEIGKILGRSKYAVRHRCSAIGVNLSAASDKTRPWSAQDRDMLRKYLSDGMKQKRIAGILGRSEASVASQAYRIRHEAIRGEASECESMNGNISLMALRLPFAQIAKAMEAA